MADEVVLLPEERLELLSDQIVQSIIGNDEVSKVNRQIVFGQLSPKVFRDENFIIYTVFHHFKDKGITPDADFIEMYLSRNTKLLKDSQGYINLADYKDLDENLYLAYTSAVLKKFNRIIQNGVLTKDDLSLTIEKYKTEFSAMEMSKAYAQSRVILYEGLQVGHRFYQGYADSMAYVKKIAADIDAVLDKTAGVGFINSREAGIEDKQEAKPVKIGDFDLITELNERLGGVFSSLFYNVIAPTKGGKSKFCARLLHTCMVKYGHNVSAWAHEGGYEAWWAQMRAIHFEYLYIRNKSANERVAPLSQNDILMGNYPSPEIRQLEEASRLDLFTNPNYGVLNMIDRPFKVETFIDELETSVQLNDSKMIVIDYLQLISWDGNKGKAEAIGNAYQQALSYCKKRNVAIISPSQFKQESMDEMANSKDGKVHELRTFGGESSEVVRTPDVNIALYASIEDLIRKKMTIMSIPSRLAEPFPDIEIYADLCSCVFASISED
jgi:hypothetical protein